MRSSHLKITDLEINSPSRWYSQSFGTELSKFQYPQPVSKMPGAWFARRNLTAQDPTNLKSLSNLLRNIRARVTICFPDYSLTRNYESSRDSQRVNVCDDMGNRGSCSFLACNKYLQQTINPATYLEGRHVIPNRQSETACAHPNTIYQMVLDACLYCSIRGN